jgi:serine/threonine protein kinase
VTIPAGTLVPRDARNFGKYELLAKIATGGMAEIFLARGTDTKRERLVLKRILPHLAEDEHFVTMFRDEASLASKLIHPNVCRVHALGHHGTNWYIVMEYLHGVALSRMLSRMAKKRQYVDYRIIAGIVIQACEGLHHAHELRDTHGHLLGVVHRDVSPPNIMLTADGAVKLLDFGIAKARGANSKTRTGTVKGKNAYMSPEQILGKPLDRRSDVFALGTVMFEMIAIKRLFHRESDFMTFKAITEEAIPDIRERRADVPPALRATLTQALARDPAGRFATAKAFAEALREAMAPLGGPASKPEIARYLASEFSEELIARDALVKSADDPNAAPATTPRALAETDPALERVDLTEELDMVDGELEVVDGAVPAASHAKIESIPSMIVSSTLLPGASGGVPSNARPLPGVAPSGRDRTAAPTPSANSLGRSAMGTPPTAMGAPPTPMTSSPSAPSPTMPRGNTGPFEMPSDPAAAVGLPDLGTDLLTTYRRKSLRNILLVLLGMVSVFAVIMVVASRGGGSSTAAATHQPVAAVEIDAAAAVDAGISVDARSLRDDITAISKYGFYSVDASAQTTIYIDRQRIGETPITRLPIKPGFHEVKAIGPRGKMKVFKITILGGQDTESPVITW